MDKIEKLKNLNKQEKELLKQELFTMEDIDKMNDLILIIHQEYEEFEINDNEIIEMTYEEFDKLSDKLKRLQNMLGWISHNNYHINKGE